MRFRQSIFTALRRPSAVPAFAALLMLFGGFVTPAHAQMIDRARFVGQVTTLLPVNGSPTSFVLLEPNVAVAISITSRTQFIGGSAEANVEGLARDDYAVVNARRVQGRWIAQRVTYDVDPILPLRTVSGSVLRLTLDGRRVNVKLDTGGNRWIMIGRVARYFLDGRAIDPPPILLKGEPVQFVINRSTIPWTALEIDLRSLS